MFDCDFLEVALPVCIEPVLLVPIAVEFVHQSGNRHVEAALEHVVELVPRLHDRLVVRCILHCDFCVDFVLRHVSRGWGVLRSTGVTLYLLSVFWAQSCKVKFEHALAQTWEAAGRPSTQVLVAFHSH